MCAKTFTSLSKRVILVYIAFLGCEEFNAIMSSTFRKKILNCLKSSFQVTYYRFYRFFEKQRTFRYRNNPKKYIDKTYFKKFGRPIDWDNPKSYFEKQNFLNIYYKNELQTTYVDKLKVKDVITQLGHPELINKTYAVFNSVEELKKFDFSSLPNKYVIKTNHSGGDVFICIDGTIKTSTGIKVARWQMFKMLKIAMKFNYYYAALENVYKDVDRKIFIEEYLESNRLDDFKFMCNNGKVQFCFIVSNRIGGLDSAIAYVDRNFKLYDARQDKPILKSSMLIKPEKWEKMIEIAELLTKSFPIARCDLYFASDKIKFGEITFFHCGIGKKFTPDSFDYYLGSHFDISKVIEKVHR